MAQAAPYILMAAGTALSAKSQMEEGADTAAQHARAAKASYAEGTRKSAEIRRQGRVLKSDAAAAMAAGGGVTDDPGAIQQLSEIEQVVDYNALTALYEGSARAKELQRTGRAAAKAGRKRALATVIGSASKMYAMGKT